MTDLRNPLKELRGAAGLTMERVCRGTQVSKQYLIKQEQGCYNEPSEVLLDFYSGYSELDVNEVKQRYYAFQRSVRKANYGRLIEPWKFIVDYHPFINWYTLSGIPSASSVCRIFCLHPSVMHRFFNRSNLINEVPSQLTAALLESGYKPETLQALQDAFTDFKHRRSELFVVETYDNQQGVTGEPNAS